MKKPSLFQLGARRFVLILIVSAVFVLIMGEIGNYLLGDGGERAPEEISLLIPAGTAEKVAAGQPEPSIPSQMSFIVGDVLIVQNQDSADHQLGPLYIPAGTTASLALEDANHFDYSCSFQPSQYLGLSVKEAAGLNVRLIALAYVTPATAIILFVYSLALFPIRLSDAPRPEADEVELPADSGVKS